MPAVIRQHACARRNAVACSCCCARWPRPRRRSPGLGPGSTDGQRASVCRSAQVRRDTQWAGRPQQSPADRSRGLGLDSGTRVSMRTLRVSRPASSPAPHRCLRPRSGSSMHRDRAPGTCVDCCCCRHCRCCSCPPARWRCAADRRPCATGSPYCACMESDGSACWSTPRCCKMTGVAGGRALMHLACAGVAAWPA